jgi:hypothetical protein
MAGRFVKRPLLVGGRGKYMSDLERQASDLKEKYRSTDSFYDQIRLLGEIGGIEYGMEEYHTQVVDLLVATKRDITEMIAANDELFRYEINYKKGLQRGIEKALDTSRYFFSLNIPILALGCFENKELSGIFGVLALKAGFTEVAICDLQPDQVQQNGNLFAFTTFIEEFVTAVDCVDSERFDVTLNLVYESKNHDGVIEHLLNLLPPIEMFRLNIVRVNEKYNADMLFKQLVKNVRL